MTGVILTALFFVNFGGNYSGQRVMLFALLACSLDSLTGLVFCLAVANFLTIYGPATNLVALRSYRFVQAQCGQLILVSDAECLETSLPKKPGKCRHIF